VSCLLGYEVRVDQILTDWCSQRLDDYALAWKKWIENPGGVFSMMHGEVIVKV
jgi:hypothetical protein